MSWKDIKALFADFSLSRILPTLLIVVICFIVAKIILRLFSRALDRSKLNRTMFTFLKTLMRIVVYSLAVLVIAGSIGIDVSSLIAVISVVSLAISLSVQSTLENVVGGISLLTAHPFHVGDFVQIGAESGTVEEMTMSYTRIETVDGKHIYVPNRDAAYARLCNFSENGKRRIDITVSASYADDIDRVKESLMRAGEHDKRLTDEPIEVYVNAYLDSGVEYLLRLWVLSENYAEVRFSVMETVKREFDAAGITIPFPQMEVRLEK